MGNTIETPSFKAELALVLLGDIPDDSGETDSSFDDSKVSDCAVLQPRLLYLSAADMGHLKCASRRHVLCINSLTQWLEDWLDQGSGTTKNAFLRDMPITIDCRTW